MASFLALVTNLVFIQSEVANFNNDQFGALTSAKIADFVDRLLPRHVRESIGLATLVVEAAHDVTLLFADILGFTEKSSTRSPGEFVKMLSTLLSAFEKESNLPNL